MKLTRQSLASAGVVLALLGIALALVVRAVV
jgi:hypothetical protein